MQSLRFGLLIAATAFLLAVIVVRLAYVLWQDVVFIVSCRIWRLMQEVGEPKNKNGGSH